MELPEDIINLLMRMVSPSSFYMLTHTSKLFHVTSHKISMNDIVADALSLDTSKVVEYILDKRSDRRRFVIINVTPSRDIILWLIKNNHHYDKDTILCLCINNNYEECLKLLINVENVDEALLYACIYDNVYILNEWRCHIDKLNITMYGDVAVRNKSYNVLDWLKNNFYVKPGSLILEHWDSDSIKWLCNNFPQFMKKKGVCTLAAKNGDLATLQWCKIKGFSLNKNTYKRAIKSGNQKIISWISSCPRQYTSIVI